MSLTIYLTVNQLVHTTGAINGLILPLQGYYRRNRISDRYYCCSDIHSRITDTWCGTIKLTGSEIDGGERKSLNKALDSPTGIEFLKTPTLTPHHFAL